MAIAEKTAEWTRLSPQKSIKPPQRDSANLRRASSPSQPSKTEWSQKKNRAKQMLASPWTSEEESPNQSDSDTDKCHLVRSNPRLYEPPGRRKRNLAFKMARHKPLRFLDQAVEKPSFDPCAIALALKRHPVLLSKADALTPKPCFQFGKEIPVLLTCFEGRKKELPITAAHSSERIEPIRQGEGFWLRLQSAQPLPGSIAGRTSGKSTRKTSGNWVASPGPR